MGGSSPTCCGDSWPRNRIRPSAVVPVMGRGLLIALLAAVVLGTLAVSGSARTGTAGGTPAPAAFRLSDGSAGCAFDGAAARGIEFSDQRSKVHGHRLPRGLGFVR